MLRPRGREPIGNQFFAQDAEAGRIDPPPGPEYVTVAWRELKQDRGDRAAIPKVLSGKR